VEKGVRFLSARNKSCRLESHLSHIREIDSGPLLGEGWYLTSHIWEKNTGGQSVNKYVAVGQTA